MFYNRKTFKLFFIVSLCLLSLSCSFLAGGSGNIEFKLPDSIDSAVSKTGETELNKKQIKFDVVIKDSKGKEVYNKRHFSGESILVNSLDVDTYEIYISGEDDNYNYTGYDKVNVIPGETTGVAIVLECEPKHEEKPVIETGAINFVLSSESHYTDALTKDAKCIIEIYKEPEDRPFITKNNVTQTDLDSGFVVDNLPAGSYRINGTGNSAEYNYTLNKNIEKKVEVKKGQTTDVTIGFQRERTVFYVDSEKGKSSGNGAKGKELQTIQQAITKILNTTSINPICGNYEINVNGNGGPVSILNKTGKELNFTIGEGCSCGTVKLSRNTNGDILPNNLTLKKCKVINGDDATTEIGKKCNLILTNGSSIEGSSNKDAVTVSDEGILTIGGSSKIKKNNVEVGVVSLSGNGKIVVNSELTGEGIVAVIKKDSYKKGDLVVDNGGFDITGKFAVENSGFIVGADGKLKATTPEGDWGTEVNLYNNLQDAVNNAENGIVTITDDTINCSNPITIPEGKSITVNAKQGTRFIRKSGFAQGPLFLVEEGASLVLDGSYGKITLDGSGDKQICDSPLIACEGNLTVKNCILQNNKNTVSDSTGGETTKGASAIFFGTPKASTVTSYGKLILENVDILNNTLESVTRGGTITIAAGSSKADTMTPVIKGGKIERNTAVNGGGIFVKGDLTLTVSDTTINDNTAYTNGGGIYMASTFEKGTSDVLLKGNTTLSGNKKGTSGYGSGVYQNMGNLTLEGQVEIRDTLNVVNDSCNLNGKKIGTGDHKGPITSKTNLN